MKLIVLSVLVFFSGLIVQAQKLDTIQLKLVEVVDTFSIISAINKIEIKNKELINSRDIGDYLRNYPNISGIRRGGIAIDPIIRGFRYNQINVLLDDGVKIENGCPNRMDPVASHVEPEDIEKIQIVKGPYVLRYGPAMGGLVHLITEQPRPYDKFQIHGKLLYSFETNWNGQKEYINLKGGNKNIFFYCSGGQKLYQSYSSGEIHGEKIIVNSFFKKYFYSAKVGYAINEKNRIIASFNSVQGRDVKYPALPMDEQKDDTKFYSLNYKSEGLPGILKAFDVKLYRSDVYHVMDNYNRPTSRLMKMIADVNVTNTGGNTIFKFQKDRLFFNIGADVENIYKDGERKMEMSMNMNNQIFVTKKQFNLWNKAKIINTGMFCETRYSKSMWNFLISARLDANMATSSDTLMIKKDNEIYFSNHKSFYLPHSLAVSIIRYLDQYNSIGLTLARASRCPNMLERFIKLVAVGYDKFDYLGNPWLKPEVNNQCEFSYQLNYEQNKLYVNAFFSYVENFISARWLPPSIVRPNTIGVWGVKQFENTRYAILTGGEVAFKTDESKKIAINISSAFTYGVIDKAVKYIYSNSQIVSSEILTHDALPEIPPFETNLSFKYKIFAEKLSTTINWRLVAAQKHTSLAFYEPHTPGFGIISASINSILMNSLNLTMGVNNIFDKSYYEHLNRNIIGTTGKLYEPGRVFFISAIYEF